MVQTIDFLVNIAHIAGVFVGFGALISVTRKGEVELSRLGAIRSVVTVGLVVIVAALIPLGFDLYGINGHILWFLCSLIFLLLNWAVMILVLRKPEYRELTTAQMRSNPVMFVFFWLLELLLQVPLILILLGLFPDLEPAFYTTALLSNLFEATSVLAQIVYSEVGPSRV